VRGLREGTTTTTAAANTTTTTTTTTIIITTAAAIYGTVTSFICNPHCNQIMHHRSAWFWLVLTPFLWCN